mmetsp:Transcript_13858/g.23115  ORF Transcript_13858/g.23115 Transcript_13858/m.23115 type:complete len:238 (-) Transcript_13858:208-921(-)
MWQLIGFFIALAYLLIGNAASKECSAGSGVCDVVDFKTYNMPTTAHFPYSAEDSSALDIIAAGMRRKNLFVMEVDVYTVGIYASIAMDTMLKQQRQEQQKTDFSSSSAEEEASFGILLHFVRAVGKNKMVDALVEAMTSPDTDSPQYTAALGEFSNILTTSIKESGMDKGGEIAFTFYGQTGSELAVVLNGQFVGSVGSDGGGGGGGGRELRARLAAVYTGTKPVAPEVTTILNVRY